MPPKPLTVEDLQNEDLYNFLQVDEKADDKQIDKAYRKLALKWHPDKNPDNPDAVDLFRKLVKVTELLKDKEVRAAYDQLRRSRKVAVERRNQLNSERRKLRDDLERQEAAAAEDVGVSRRARESLAAKIRRLQEEGAQLVQASEEKLRQEWAETRAADAATSAAASTEGLSGTMEIRWDKTQTYSESDLRQSLAKFGTLAAVIMSRKGGRAVVEFENPSCAASAVRTGIPGLMLSLPAGESAASSPAPAPREAAANSPRPTVTVPQPQPSPSVPTVPAAKRKMTEEEVFALMRAAQKRKAEPCPGQ